MRTSAINSQDGQSRLPDLYRGPASASEHTQDADTESRAREFNVFSRYLEAGTALATSRFLETAHAALTDGSAARILDDGD
jgi:hypothetical protein